MGVEAVSPPPYKYSVISPQAIQPSRSDILEWLNKRIHSSIPLY